MVKMISLDALMDFPIRKDHYDKEHGNEHYIFGVEAVLEYAKNLPSMDAVPAGAYELLYGQWMMVKEVSRG